MKKILIADDEQDILKVLKKRLSEAGYTVLATNKGNDVMGIAKNEQPNLIVLDVMMPDLDGGSVGEMLKNEPLTKDIPVIFLTALYTKGEESQLGHISGKNIIIAKPYEPEELLEEIQKRIASD